MAKLIHLVGPSGTGKTSVHKSLTSLIEQLDYEVVPLVEPGPLREQISTYKKSPYHNVFTEALLFAADRSLLYASEVFPRLDDPNVVFTFARGLPDSLVYQGIIGGVSPEIILHLNHAIPPSDLYLVLLVEGSVGHARVLERQKKTGEPISRNETPEAIDRLAQGYRQLDRYFPSIQIIDTTRLTLEQTTQLCLGHIEHVLSQRGRHGS